MKIVKGAFFFLFILLAACGHRDERQIPNRQGVTTNKAMVVSAHPLASRVGADIMKKGGNAVDAAIAVHFALAVVHPAAGNIGGGGFMVFRTNTGAYHSLDYREKAPALASRNMYLNELGEVDPEKSRLGYLAAGVPGSVDGMVEAHQKFGSRPWPELVAPAIRLARDGFTLTENEANGLNYNQENFEKYNMMAPEFLMKSEWQEGDTIYYHDLANTLERIGEFGRAGFYEGETARLIVREMERGDGLISYEDLINYQSVWRAPISFDYKAYKITSMAPPSSGGVAIRQLFQIVEPFPMRDWGPDHENAIHLMVEAEKLVYADRAKYLGDPDFVDVPVQQLTENNYLMERMSSIDFAKTTAADEIYAGTFLAESEETTHFSIVDPFGNAVSSTTTLNGGYGSKVVVAGAGFFLNNEMDDFSAKPGTPNMYGLVGGEANAIVPNKRMLSSMTPTIVEKDNELFMVVGTPGGSTIITSVFQTILNVIEFDMNMQGAVDFERFHHQWRPDFIQYEPGRFTDFASDALTRKGHDLRERSSIGRVDAILILDDGRLEGGADPRGDDAAVGF
jgi:gamma-glutamyltranspeptidase/glutathione hydrolase